MIAIPRYANQKNYSDEEIALWNLLTDHQGDSFHTAKGLEFTYKLCGNEIFISRKEKSITRATVNTAYRSALTLMEDEGYVSGPKRLGTFGSSYLYAIFLSLGLIRQFSPKQTVLGEPTAK